jgi:hypothetical protein
MMGKYKKKYLSHNLQEENLQNAMSAVRTITTANAGFMHYL